MKYIPEGATHTAPGGTYRMLTGGYWRQYADGDWILIKSPAPHLYTPIEDEIVELNAPKVVEWDGVGDPPAMSKIEYKSVGGTWKRGVFVGRVYGKIVAGCDDTEAVGWLPSDEMRPIRTAEQVAAEEIRSIIESGLNGNKTMTMVVKEIIEAGYRKQVEK